MPNPQLNEVQRKELFAPLLESVKEKLVQLSGNDPDLLFALRRKLAKELTYLERGGPMLRRKLKASKRIEQNGLCAVCHLPLPEQYAELDRIEAKLGYTAANTRLVHHDCHITQQKQNKYM
jgi:hypothetical protein